MKRNQFCKGGTRQGPVSTPIYRLGAGELRSVKQLVADLSLDKHILQEVLSKKL